MFEVLSLRGMQMILTGRRANKELGSEIRSGRVDENVSWDAPVLLYIELLQ